MAAFLHGLLCLLLVILLHILCSLLALDLLFAQLVARCVVDDIHDTHLSCAILRAPCKISVVNAQGSVLSVAAAAADRSDALLAELAQGRRPAHLELALLLVNVS